eukprot:CAMPEP_0202923564 /NCGR_PEP_ID=MMETSP1392-20130828/78517_1 /ASSEMBLY_ACC=CAM_ASM_000868 /TAXON_ID=225041 /ORGANISM="Chlamydomonas chlamydogama, Strain SAG 11-48b" /LENGTH=113 /DNA_ID=CAMNT_0049617253 /DNA_START=670 /DNA_END=1012 /DNA_ORIENTATION=+
MAAAAGVVARSEAHAALLGFMFHIAASTAQGRPAPATTATAAFVRGRPCAACEQASAAVSIGKACNTDSLPLEVLEVVRMRCCWMRRNDVSASCTRCSVVDAQGGRARSILVI